MRFTQIQFNNNLSLVFSPIKKSFCNHFSTWFQNDFCLVTMFCLFFSAFLSVLLVSRLHFWFHILHSKTEKQGYGFWYTLRPFSRCVFLFFSPGLLSSLCIMCRQHTVIYIHNAFYHPADFNTKKLFYQIYTNTFLLILSLEYII